MSKWRKKPIVIEAEQFLLEEKHPLFGEPKALNIPEGVVKEKFYDYQDPKPLL